MKKHLTFIIFAIISALASCSRDYSPQTITCNVAGTVDNMTGKVYVVPVGYSLKDALSEIDINDGAFSGSFEGDPGLAYELAVFDYSQGMGYVTNFFADENVSFVCDGNAATPVFVISGGRTNKALSELTLNADELFHSRYAEVEAQIDGLYAQNKAYTEEGYTPEYLALQKKSFDLESERTLFLIDQMRSKVDLASFFTLYNTMLQDCELYDNINAYVGVTPEMAESIRAEISMLQDLYANTYSTQFAGHPFHDAVSRISSRPILNEGGKYFDFTLPDADGVEHSISSLIDGKVAVLDFWASWCRPCRETAISMKPLWEKYKDKGLIIVGMAREYGSDKAWRKALSTDGCPWPQLIALDSDHDIWDIYGIASAAGSLFLVDKDGSIIKVDPSLEEIEAMLK